MSAAAGGTSADGSGNTSGRGISGSSTGNGANNNDPEIDHVIERCLDEEIQKANLDTYKYRYLNMVLAKVQVTCPEKVPFIQHQVTSCSKFGQIL